MNNCVFRNENANFHPHSHKPGLKNPRPGTEVEVFLGKEVREARADGGGEHVRHGGATKKREISRTSLPINLHFSVRVMGHGG